MSEIQSGMEADNCHFFLASHTQVPPKCNARASQPPYTLYCQSVDPVKIFVSGLLTMLAYWWALVGWHEWG